MKYKPAHKIENCPDYTEKPPRKILFWSFRRKGCIYSLNCQDSRAWGYSDGSYPCYGHRSVSFCRKCGEDADGITTLCDNCRKEEGAY